MLICITFTLCLLLTVHTSWGQLPIGCNRQITVKSGDICWNIASENNISVDDLLKFNSKLNCNALQLDQVLCVSLAECKKAATIRSGDTCWSISTSNGISATELQELNPPGVDCNMLVVGQVVCVSRNQQTTQQTTTAQQTPQSCKSVSVNTGDTCWSISTSNGITIAELEEFNSPGFDCSLLTVGQKVCVNRNQQTTTAQPTQTPQSCQSVSVNAGDTCWSISTSNGITIAELEEFNSPGFDCNLLAVGQKVCVNRNQQTTQQTTTAQPTQTPQSCKSVSVNTGDTCWSISTSNGITIAELEEFNYPGFDCNLLTVGQKVCVNRNQQMITAQPTQTPQSCKSVSVNTGDTCWSISTSNGITIAELEEFNSPGFDCNLLTIGQKVCVNRNQQTTTAQPTQTPQSCKSVSVNAGDTCWSISTSNGITIAELEEFNSPGFDCNLLRIGQKVCVNRNQQTTTAQPTQTPQSCKSVSVNAGDTCWSISTSNGITIAELEEFNSPGFDCNLLTIGQKVCVNRNQQTTTAQPTQTPQSCKSVSVNTGDTCWSISTSNGITIAELEEFNYPGFDCNLLTVGQKVCVNRNQQMITAQPTQTPQSCKSVSVNTGDTCWSISTSNGITIAELEEFNSPGFDCNLLTIGQKVCVNRNQQTTTVQPTQTPQSCKSVSVNAGDTCWSISTSNGITIAELEEFNSPGFDCNLLTVGQKVCVNRNQQTTTAQPTQTPQSCKSVRVNTGDTCWSISTSNGITIAELEEFNSPGFDCNLLTVGQKICVSRINSPDTESFSCKTTKVYSEDTCWSIATRNSLTLEQLMELNPKVDCSLLLPGQLICIRTCDLKYQPKISANCKTVFVQDSGLTCEQIETQFGLADGELARLNSNYACCENKTTVLPFGRRLCVKLNDDIPACSKEYVIIPGDSCWSIWVSHRLSESQFHKLNPEINCDNLLAGESICISNQDIIGQECALTMTAQPGDTCQKLAQKAGITIEVLQNLNRDNLNCGNVQAQQIVCINNDQQFKVYERNDEGPTKQMLESTVRQILSGGTVKDQTTITLLNEYLAGRVPPEDIIPDVSKILSSTEGGSILESLKGNKEFQDFDTMNNDHRSQLCNTLAPGTYKTCICDANVPFIQCQAQLFQTGKELSRRRRDLQYMLQNVTRTLHRYRRSTKGESDILKPNPLQGVLNSFCRGCLSSDTACVDVDACVPAFVILEICLGAGFCVPNPLSLIDTGGHITVSQFEDSNVGIDLSLCITILNEILQFFGADACIAKGGVDYYYLKQQLTFHGTISLFVVRGIVDGRVQVAEPFSEGVYDSDAQKLLDDMCTEEKYQCNDYCQVLSGDVFVKYKVQGWLFGWHDIASGSKNDPPPCKPKPKKIEPPEASLDRVVLYTTSWAQYRAFNATIDGKLITRPDSCKPHARTPKDIDASLITHLNFAFLVIDENTFELKNFERNDDELIAEMMALGGDLKKMISIGGWSFSQGETALGEETKKIFSNMARTQEGRARFIASAVDYVIRHNIDGIDIDWEYPLPEDRDSFTYLLLELRSAIDASGKDILLTIAAPAGRKWYSNIDLESIHQFVDFINLMTYDFHGGSFDTGGPNVNAPIVDCSCPEIEDIELGLESYLAAGVPSEKINLGMATYGRTFTLDSAHNALSDTETLRNGGSKGAGNQGVCTLTPGVLSYYEIKDLVSDDKVITDKTLMSAYARFDKDQWVGYDTKETHDMKMCFARRKRLGGIMIWDGEMDDQLELVKNMRDNIATNNCDSFEIPDCPSSRKKRAAIRPKPSKPTKNPSNSPECDKIPPIKNKDTTAMRSCQGTKVGGTCKVVCKENYKPTKSYITCRKVGLTRAVWSTDVDCELDPEDCGDRPYPIIRVAENGGSGATLYYARIDPVKKLPLWSLYAQRKIAPPAPRVDGFKQHNCHKDGQLLPSSYTNLERDRGHLSPQNAFSFSRLAMKATNFMINIAPQDPSTNSGMWKTLESKVKEFLQEFPGFVVTGVCTKTITIKGIRVPDCFWKMICTSTPKGTTTVGVFYHENVKAADPEDRRKEVKQVRDQTFVLTKSTGPGTSLVDVWATAAKLSATVPGLPNPGACAASLTLGTGGINDLFNGKSARSGGGEDLKQFWDDNIGSDKYGLKWGLEYPEDEPQDTGDDEEDEEEDEDYYDEDYYYDDDEFFGAGGNVLSGKTRNRCGYEIKY